MSEELKPCPFCGHRHLNGNKDTWGDSPAYYVSCVNCSTRGRIGYSVEEANTLWNSRPSEDALRADLAESEKANFELAAGACLYSDGTGIYGDERGHACCHKSEALERKESLIAALDELVELYDSWTPLGHTVDWANKFEAARARLHDAGKRNTTK